MMEGYPTITLVNELLTGFAKPDDTWPRCQGEPYGYHTPICESTDGMALISGSLRLAGTVSTKKVLLCVTATSNVERYAKANDYSLVVSHHPYLIDHPQIILHTALDCCKGGINDMWAEFLDMDMETATHFDGNLGWRGSLKEGMPFEELLGKIAHFTGGIRGVVRGHATSVVNSVVICSGLGGLVYSEAYGDGGTDCYITGELTAGCQRTDVPNFGYLVEVGHTLSERMILPKLKKMIEDEFPDVQADVAPLEIDYFGSEVI